MFSNWKDWNQFIGGIAGNYFVPGIWEHPHTDIGSFHTTKKSNFSSKCNSSFSSVILQMKFFVFFISNVISNFQNWRSHPQLSVLFRHQYIFCSLSFCCELFSTKPQTFFCDQNTWREKIHYTIRSCKFNIWMILLFNQMKICQLNWLYELYQLYEFPTTSEFDLWPTLGNALEKVWKAGEENYINLWYQHSQLNSNVS